MRGSTKERDAFFDPILDEAEARFGFPTLIMTGDGAKRGGISEGPSVSATAGRFFNSLSGNGDRIGVRNSDNFD